MKHGPPFFADYDTDLKMCKLKDTLIAGMDGNSSMGTNDGNICDPFGVTHTNDTGKRMHYFLSIRGLTTTTTFFQKYPTEHGSIHAQNSLTNWTTSQQTRTNSAPSQMQESQRAWSTQTTVRSNASSAYN